MMAVWAMTLSTGWSGCWSTRCSWWLPKPTVIPPAACLVCFATQTSLSPPRFLVGLSRNNHPCRVAARSQHLAMHVLARRHIGLTHLFGGQTGDRVNKFDHCSWRTGPEGMPILDDAVAWFV